jgi:hypothetical protein
MKLMNKGSVCVLRKFGQFNKIKLKEDKFNILQ